MISVATARPGGFYGGYGGFGYGYGLGYHYPYYGGYYRYPFYGHYYGGEFSKILPKSFYFFFRDVNKFEIIIT